jgi:hypothetical protein
MNIIEFYAEAYRQIAFVSAVLGGFSVAFLGVLLVAGDERKLAGWTIGISIASSVMFIIATFLDSFLVFTLPGFAAQSLEDLPESVLGIAGWAVFAFYGGVFALLSSLSLGGWLRSKQVGIAATSISAFAALIILRGAYVLGIALNG